MTRSPIYYSISGSEIVVVSKYSRKQDIAVTLKKRGVNQIFDFYDIAMIENTQQQISTALESRTTLYSPCGIGTDWHGAFSMQAVENIDGDLPLCNHFTGGNHGYDNTGSLDASATGRTFCYAFYADGYPVDAGTGWCNALRLTWSNLVQGQNTIKKDGSGREIMRENHVLTFNGREWTSYTELIPLEKLRMKRFYGPMCSMSDTYYPYVRFVGGVNRGLLGKGADCGNRDCNRIEVMGSEHKLIMELDPLLDLGKREMYVGNKGAFSATYGKAYFSLLNEQSEEALRIWKPGELYAFRGKFIFEPVA